MIKNSKNKSKLNKRAVRVFSICLILMLVLPIISVFFVGASSISYKYLLGCTTYGNTSSYTWDNTIDKTLNWHIEYNGNIYNIATYSLRNFHNVSGSTYNYGYYFYIDSRSYLGFYYKKDSGGNTTIGFRYNLYNVNTSSSSTVFSYTWGYSSRNFYFDGNGNKPYITIDNTFDDAYDLVSTNNSKWLEFKFDTLIIGYTLTFNSQGGSSINPIEGIEEGETILLGDSNGYFPEYVPTKPYYIFDGWSLSEEGSIVRQVTVTDDTTLYAQYHVNPSNCQILTSSTNNYASFYSDSSFTTSLPPIVTAGANVVLDVWIQDNSPTNWYFDYLEVEYNNSTHRLYAETIYLHFTIPIEQAGYVQLNAVYVQRHTVEVRYNPSGDSSDNTFDFFNTDNAFLTGETVHLWGGYSFPTFWTNTRIIGKNSSRIYESHVNVYDEWNESAEGFDFDMYFTMPDEDVIVMVFWSVMSGVPAQPSVSYDESGNPYFVGIDEEDIFSQDFSRANDLIPEQLIGVAEYFTYFDGLTVIVTIILVAGFAAYILRHSV